MRRKGCGFGLERSHTFGVEQASLGPCGSASLGCSGFWFGSKVGQGAGVQQGVKSGRGGMCGDVGRGGFLERT